MQNVANYFQKAHDAMEAREASRGLRDDVREARRAVSEANTCLLEYTKIKYSLFGSGQVPPQVLLSVQADIDGAKSRLDRAEEELCKAKDLLKKAQKEHTNIQEGRLQSLVQQGSPSPKLASLSARGHMPPVISPPSTSVKMPSTSVSPVSMSVPKAKDVRACGARSDGGKGVSFDGAISDGDAADGVCDLCGESSTNCTCKKALCCDCKGLMVGFVHHCIQCREPLHAVCGHADGDDDSARMCQKCFSTKI